MKLTNNTDNVINSTHIDSRKYYNTPLSLVVQISFYSFINLINKHRLMSERGGVEKINIVACTKYLNVMLAYYNAHTGD